MGAELCYVENNFAQHLYNFKDILDWHVYYTKKRRWMLVSRK